MRINKLDYVVLTALLSAISIVLRVAFEFLDGSIIFSIPVYTIALILCGILCGPVNGLFAGVIVDIISSLIIGWQFVPVSMLVPIAWGLIPGLLYQKKETKTVLVVGITIAHLFATTINTLVLVFIFNLKFSNLSFRFYLVPINIVLLSIISILILRGVSYVEKK